MAMTAATRRRRKRAREADVVTFNMRSGEPGAQAPIEPYLSVVGFGSQAYIWVGTDKGGCFATLDGAGLRKLVGRLLSRRRKPASR